MADSSKGLTSFGRLAIVLDLSPASWASLFQEQDASDQASLSLSSFLDQIIAFSRQYSMLNRNNRISLISISPKCHVHYPVRINGASGNPDVKVSSPFEFSSFHEAITNMVQTVKGSSEQGILQLSVAISRAFLFLNRQDHDLCGSNEEETDIEIAPLLLGSSSFPARIVVFSLTPDAPSQVLPTLSALFACHKQDITVDTCFITTPHSRQYSPLLQVASELTSGYHCTIHSLAQLQHSLLTIFLVDAPLRNELKMPKLVHVDHKATCFCHKRLTSIGYVCSVCLAIFCQPCQPCLVCGVSYADESLPTQLSVDINEYST
jgi:transcription initiation factor TFIIH subunit 3